ncbi:MAG TPA: hypothetical protein VF812_02520 [Ktedonobacterales bacterium]
MRYYRRLPPLLRVASILGLLFALTALALFVALFVARIDAILESIPQDRLSDYRWLAIGLNLGLLSGACFTAVNWYVTRFREPPPAPLPLGSRRSQLRAILLLAALPLCAILLASVIPPESDWFGVVFGVSLLGALVTVAKNTALVVMSGI